MGIGDGEDLLHGVLEHAARLWQGAEHTHRGPRHRSDAAQRRDEEKLLPHRHADVRWDGRGDALRTLEGLVQALDPPAVAAVQLAKGDGRPDASVADVAGLDEGADDPAQPAQYVMLPEDDAQLGRRLDAVLQRHDERVGADHGAHLPGRLGHLPCLDGDEDRVDQADLPRIVRRLHRVDGEVSFDALNMQTVHLHRFEMLSASDKHHVLPRLGEAAAEVSPDGPGAKDCYAHRQSPLSVYLRCLRYGHRSSSCPQPLPLLPSYPTTLSRIRTCRCCAS